MEVTDEQFRAQIDWLAANRRVVGLDPAVEAWSHPGSEKMVVLTFDDGYRDVLTNAYPVLREYGFPFTLYLSTESIETGKPLGGGAAAAPLSWSEIEVMLDSGLVTIGAHTHSHADLRSLSTSQVKNEIEVSNELIWSRLAIVPTHFAYPWGYWSPDADEVVRDTYKSAVLGGTPKPDPRPDIYRLHRYPIQLSDGMRYFIERLNGGLRAEELVRRRLAGYSGP